MSGVVLLGGLPHLPDYADRFRPDIGLIGVAPRLDRALELAHRLDRPPTPRVEPVEGANLVHGLVREGELVGVDAKHVHPVGEFREKGHRRVLVERPPELIEEVLENLGASLGAEDLGLRGGEQLVADRCAPDRLRDLLGGGRRALHLEGSPHLTP